VQLVSILGFAWLAYENRPDKLMLAGVIAFEALAWASAPRRSSRYIARATDPRYTATQFALFTSLAAVPRTVVNASTGWVVEQTGWYTFFLLCTVLALPGMALLLRVAPWNEREDGNDDTIRATWRSCGRSASRAGSRRACSCLRVSRAPRSPPATPLPGARAARRDRPGARLAL
jgi:hypothetical protein